MQCKMPRDVRFVADFTRSQTPKVLKRQLSKPPRDFDALHLMEHLLITFGPICSMLSSREISGWKLFIMPLGGMLISIHLVVKSRRKAWSWALLIFYLPMGIWSLILLLGEAAHFLKPFR